MQVSDAVAKLSGCVRTLCQNQQYILQGMNAVGNCQCGPLTLCISGAYPYTTNAPNDTSILNIIHGVDDVPGGTNNAAIGSIIMHGTASCKTLFFEATNDFVHSLSIPVPLTAEAGYEVELTLTDKSGNQILLSTNTSDKQYFYYHDNCTIESTGIIVP